MARGGKSVRYYYCTREDEFSSVFSTYLVHLCRSLVFVGVCFLALCRVFPAWRIARVLEADDLETIGSHTILQPASQQKLSTPQSRHEMTTSRTGTEPLVELKRRVIQRLASLCNKLWCTFETHGNFPKKPDSRERDSNQAYLTIPSSVRVKRLTTFPRPPSVAFPAYIGSPPSTPSFRGEEARDVCPQQESTSRARR